MSKKSHPAGKPGKSLSLDKNGRQIHIGDIVIEENEIVGRVVAIDRNALLFRAFKGNKYGSGQTVGEDCSNCTLLVETDPGEGQRLPAVSRRGAISPRREVVL